MECKPLGPNEMVLYISATELPEYERLIEFLAAVDEYAARECFLDLKEMVESCRHDLEAMH
jgi:nitrate reductase assembly molybdenum cofactor insertion protein NarJ